MSDADKIRQYCLEHYVNLARARGDYTVTIRAGDVAKAVTSGTNLPAVCGALGSNRFEADARVRRLAVDGPLHGANTLFVFRVQ